MGEETAVQLLESAGVVLSDSHFVLSAGEHSDTFIFVKRFGIYPGLMKQLAPLMAGLVPIHEYDVVIGIAMGTVTMASRVAEAAYDLGHAGVIALYAQKTPDGSDFLMEKGMEEFLPGKRVLVVEDVSTSGGSAGKVVRLVRSHGGIVRYVITVWNRNGVTAEDIGPDLELRSLINRHIDSWPLEECRASGPCARGVAFNTKIGSFKKWAEIQGLVA